MSQDIAWITSLHINASVGPYGVSTGVNHSSPLTAYPTTAAVAASASSANVGPGSVNATSSYGVDGEDGALNLSLVEAISFSILMSICICATIVGNILVILSVFLYRPLKSVQNFFIVSLAVADLAVAVLVMPFNVANFVLGYWVFGAVFCNIWLTSDILTCTASILNLCAIAIDRYYAIHDPFNYAHKRTLKRVLLTICLVWVASALISVPPLIGWNNSSGSSLFDEATGQCQLTNEKGFVLYSASGSFYIPLFIMTFVYVNIFVATRRRLRARAKAAAATRTRRDDNQAAVAKEAETKFARNNETSSYDSPEENQENGCGDTDAQQVTKNGTAGGHTKKLLRPTNGQSVVLDSRTETTVCDTMTESTLRLTQADPELDCEGSPRLSPAVSDHGIDKKSSSSGKCKTAAAPNPSGVKVMQFIEQRQKISLSKERRAARTMGIIMTSFVVCWLPFFLMYIIFPFCPSCAEKTDHRVINFIVWLGYVNSALNPVIYTIFNIDFRRAFKYLLQGKCRT